MLIIKDRTFDARYFKGLLEYLDSIYSIQLLSEKTVNYSVVYDGRHPSGFKHRIHMSSAENGEIKSFNIIVYENQSLRVKGYFKIQIKDIKFDARKNGRELKKMGFKWDMKGEGINRVYAVHLTNLVEDVPKLIRHFSEYIL